MRVVCTLFLIAVAATAAFAQVKPGADQRYMILEVAKISTLEKELTEAANQGFQLKMSTTAGIKVEALMERTATPPDVYQYKIVATFQKKTGEKEMNDVAAQGFRVVPHSFMIKQGLTVFNTNAIVIMEKVPKSAAAYEYKSIAAVRTTEFDKQLKEAATEGWTVIDMVYGMVVLERPRKTTS